MPTVFKEVQDEDGVRETSVQDSPRSLDSSPDIVLEHGSTRLSLDLDGWEWFWLFLAVVFSASLFMFLR